MTDAWLFIQERAVSDELREYALKYGITLKKYDEITTFLKTVTAERVLFDEDNVSYALYRILREKTELSLDANPTEKLKAVKIRWNSPIWKRYI